MYEKLLGREYASPSGLKIPKSLHKLSKAADIYTDGVSIYIVQASVVCVFCGALTVMDFKGYGVCHHCKKEASNEGTRN